MISTSQINLVWTKGTYANYTRIQRKTGSYPQNISDGVTVYNGTNSSCSVTGLSPGTLYYFRAWSWNSSLGVWSITYASAQATTQGDGGGGEETPPPAEGEAPIAEAGGPYSGYVNQTITFNAGLSSDDVQIVGYRWDWTNDGTWDTNWLLLSKTTHVYSTPGNYTVNLQVQDEEDLRDNDTAIVIVIMGGSQQQAPVADAAGPYHGLTYQNIQFNGSKSYAIATNIVNYTWVFGDGTYGYGASPTHSYESAGTFTVILTVTDSNTLQAIDTTLATILLDANRNNLSDVIDEAIGADITSDDLRGVTIDGVLYYLVDTDHDGRSDAFYNPITNKKTILGIQDDKQLIDLDGDGKWDYLYDPALGVTEPYIEIVTPLNTPWLGITISVIIFVVILLIVWLYKSGRV
ncbi:MAG: PKD domain-containing protein [Candidatus Thermoplasmatota archaeon]|nr:PKD domain-containing protein [Candidatus Thermoplasmatota archaeon]